MYKVSSDIVILNDCAFNKRNGDAYVIDKCVKSLLLDTELDNKIRDPKRAKDLKYLIANGIIVDDSFDESKDVFHIQWHLLNSCNLKCKHCYDWKEKINTLTFGQMCKVVDDFVFFLKKINFNGEISLTGGEPTLFEHLPELIKYIKSRDVHISLFILSNGLAFSDTLIKILQENDIGVQVSLDGLQKTHDAIRGKGSFSKVLKTMDLLKTNGINPLAELILHEKNDKYMNKKLYISLKFSILAVEKTVKILVQIMYNFAAKFAKILETCKKFSTDLVNDLGNIPRRGVVPKFSDLEVIAMSMTAESESIDSENRLFELLKHCKSDFPNLISRRQYNDRRKITSGLCEQIRKRIAYEIDGGEDYFCVDSKPIPVCRTSRGKRCKMGKEEFSTAPDFGFCASQNVYYFGYKLHELCGLSGVVHSYDLSKASVHDIHYLKDIKSTYHDCSIFGDKAYISADIQLDLFETANIRLECPYRLNQKDWKPTFQPFAKARKRVETNFSQLTDQYMVIRNYAKQTDGLFARIIGKISAQTIAQYFNYINNKPIGRVKYALD